MISRNLLRRAFARSSLVAVVATHASPRCHVEGTTLRTTWKPANYPHNPQTVGEHIRRKRIDLGLQVKEVATQLGTDEQSVSGWEIGHRQPSLVHLPAVIHWLRYDPRPLTESLGLRIRRWREGRGVSQMALAKRLNVDPGTLARWEKGVREPQHRDRGRVLRLLEKGTE